MNPARSSDYSLSSYKKSFYNFWRIGWYACMFKEMRVNKPEIGQETVHFSTTIEADVPGESNNNIRVHKEHEGQVGLLDCWSMLTGN